MNQLDIFTGKNKTELALDFLRLHEPPEGYFVGFSGGKDSVVMLDLVRKSGVKHRAFYSATQIDPPELVRFIHANYPDVKWLFPKESFFRLIAKKGYPSRQRRWCCEHIKERPARKAERLYQAKVTGIRAEESVNRAKRPQIDPWGKTLNLKPLYHWLEWEIWEYIHENNLPYCGLYDEGFSRMGCVVCPFICRPDRKEIDRRRARWPRQYAAFEAAMLELWGRKKHQLYANTFEEFLDGWYRGGGAMKLNQQQGGDYGLEADWGSAEGKLSMGVGLRIKPGDGSVQIWPLENTLRPQ